VSRKRPCPVGARYGKLVVLGELEPVVSTRFDGRTDLLRRWLCRCDCGVELSRHARSLELGKTESCGCGKRKGTLQHATVPGARYGRFTVLGDAPPQPDKLRRWLCRCDCGTEKAVLVSSLARSRSVSCGCYLEDIRKGLVSSRMLGKNVRYQPEELPDCPVCGTRQKRQYEIVFCPRRCDGVLAVRPRKRAA